MRFLALLSILLVLDITVQGFPRIRSSDVANRLRHRYPKVSDVLQERNKNGILRIIPELVPRHGHFRVGKQARLRICLSACDLVA